MLNGIDFLPAEYWKRRATKRDHYYILAIGGALVIMLFGSIGHESHKASLIRTQLAAVDGEYASVLDKTVEVKRLEDRRKPLAFQAKFFSLLRARASFSRALVAIATSCPPHVSLTDITFKREQPNIPTDRKPPSIRSAQTTELSPEAARSEQLDRYSKDREWSRVSLHIGGVAETGPDVTLLVERLQREDCFQDVTFNLSDDATPGPVPLRKFTIQLSLTKVF